MVIRFIIMVVAVVLTGPIFAAPAAFLITEVLNNRVAIYSEKGERLWQYEVRKPVDVWPTERGTVLVTFNGKKKGGIPGGIREVNRAGETLFEYQTEGEVMSCCPLPNGNWAVAECTLGRITEVSRKGAVVRTFNVVSKGMGHKTVRHIRSTDRGTILACEKYAHAVREYDWTGHLLREIQTEYPFTAQELPNGNLLVAHYHNPRLVEFDRQGEAVWTLKADELTEADGLDHFCDVTVLEDGTILFANATKKAGEQIVTALTVSRNKKLIWCFKDAQHTKEVTAVKPLNEAWLSHWRQDVR